MIEFHGGMQRRRRRRRRVKNLKYFSLFSFVPLIHLLGLLTPIVTVKNAKFVERNALSMTLSSSSSSLSSLLLLLSMRSSSFSSSSVVGYPFPEIPTTFSHIAFALRFNRRNRNPSVFIPPIRHFTDDNSVSVQPPRFSTISTFK